MTYNGINTATHCIVKWLIESGLHCCEHLAVEIQQSADRPYHAHNALQPTQCCCTIVASIAAVSTISTRNVTQVLRAIERYFTSNLTLLNYPLILSYCLPRFFVRKTHQKNNLCTLYHYIIID